jgi:hypothetical protein
LLTNNTDEINNKEKSNAKENNRINPNDPFKKNDSTARIKNKTNAIAKNIW